MGPRTPYGPLARPGHFPPLVRRPGLAETCLQAQLLPGSRPSPRAWPSWSCPGTPTLLRGLCGALFTPRACHMAQALPAGTVRGSRPRGGAVSGPRTRRTAPGSGLSGSGVPVLRVGVSPSPDLSTACPRCRPPRRPLQGPARPGPAQSQGLPSPRSRTPRDPSWSRTLLDAHPAGDALSDCPESSVRWSRGRPSPAACPGVRPPGACGPGRGSEPPGPGHGRGRGLSDGRRGPGRAGRGLTDLPSRLRTSGAHAGAAPGGEGAPLPPGPPQEPEKKTRPEFKTKRRKCPNGAERRVRGAALGACALRGPAPTRRPGGGGAGRGRGGAWPKGAGAFCRGSEAPREGRVLGAGRGRGRAQSVGGVGGGVSGGNIGAGLCGGLPGHV